jgi:hypothetical protein
MPFYYTQYHALLQQKVMGERQLPANDENAAESPCFLISWVLRG